MERLWRWRVALMATGVTAVAAALRLVGLGYPRALVFDELYYARGAYSLLRLGYEGNWGKDEGTFALGDFSHLQSAGDYVVHPLVGKLLIAAGMNVAGPTPFGWRISGAVVGTVTVLVVALLARSMLRSTLWGGVAGLLLAVDGEAVVLSRTALLDGFLTFFVVLGVALLWLDRLWMQRRLRAAPGPVPGLRPHRPPRLGPRWWRWASLIAWGMACSTKWSGAYIAAGMLVLSVVWEALDRRRAGYRFWLRDTTVRSAIPGAVAALVTIPAVYVASWANWFLVPGSYMRDWAARHPGEGVTWLPEALRSLLEYHRQMLTFHTGLTSEHPYESHPMGWILQFRPTAFFWQDVPANCGADRCISAIHALGIPLVWWGALAALCFAVWRGVLRRDLMGLWIAVPLVLGFVPWWPLAHRTIFTFYTVVMAPFVVLIVVWALARIAQPPQRGGRFHPTGAGAVGWYVVAVLAMSAFFVPIWLGTPIPYWYWQLHMWLPTWA